MKWNGMKSTEKSKEKCTENVVQQDAVQQIFCIVHSIA